MENLAGLDGYGWSGHSVIVGEGQLEGQVTTEILSYFGKSRREAIRQYRKFVEDGIRLGKLEELSSSRRMPKIDHEDVGDESYDHRILGSGGFVDELRVRQELESRFSRPMEIGDLVRKVCGHFGTSADDLRLKTREARIGAGVSVACGCGERLVNDDRALLDLLEA